METRSVLSKGFDDLDIIKSSPNIRRNLLNIQLSQISKVYLNTYNEYNKILKTRNEYLKILFSSSVADKNYLDIITDRLIESYSLTSYTGNSKAHNNLPPYLAICIWKRTN